MLGVALPVLPALGAALLLGSVDVDQAVFARVEAAAGIAPPAPGESAEPALAAELRPGGALRFRTERSTLTLRLEPRLHYRTPNPADLDRPLVLVRGDVNHQYAASPRLGWRTSVTSSYGEVDYLDLDLASDTLAPTRELRDPVVTRFSADAQTGFAWQATRRYELSIDAVASYQVDVGDDEAVDPGVMPPVVGLDTLPETLVVGFDVVQEYELDERSLLRVPVSPRYYSVTPGPDQMAVSIDVFYRRLLDPLTSMEAGAGAAIVKEVGDDVSVLPRAAVAYERVMSTERRRRSVLRLRAALETPFDPILGDLRPIASFEASQMRELDRDWTLNVVIQAATVTTAEPLADGSAESTAAATAMAMYRIAPWLLFDFGTRLSTRAPHVAADSFELTESQVWGFAGLTGVLSSASPEDWSL